MIQCPVHVCVLPFCGYRYALALPNEPHLLKALNACMAFLGAVPSNLKSDNMKQIVQKSCRYEPVFTETIQQWALHNGLALLRNIWGTLSWNTGVLSSEYLIKIIISHMSL